MQGLLKNTLDMMHCEKKLCENIYKKYWHKDYVAIQDFKECGIRPHLWIQNINGWLVKLVASFVLSNRDKNKFIHTIMNIKTPTLYASSLRKRIAKDGGLKVMKSHDFHVMMQDILPLCMHGLCEQVVGCQLCACAVFSKNYVQRFWTQ
jgi:hypothetical protein